MGRWGWGGGVTKTLLCITHRGQRSFAQGLLLVSFLGRVMFHCSFSVLYLGVPLMGYKRSAGLQNPKP